MLNSGSALIAGHRWDAREILSALRNAAIDDAVDSGSGYSSIDDPRHRADSAGQDVNRRPAAQKIVDHFARNYRRIRTYALARYTMITAENKNRTAVKRRHGSMLNTAQLNDALLKDAQAAAGFGQRIPTDSNGFGNFSRTNVRHAGDSASIERFIVKRNHLAVLLLKFGGITPVDQITKRGVNPLMGDNSRISWTTADHIPGALDSRKKHGP